MSRKLTNEEANKVLNDVGLTWIDGEYIGMNNHNIICKDSFGYKYKVRLSDIYVGKFPTKFFKTNPFSIENLELYLRFNTNYKLKQGQEYKNNITKMIFICPIHGEFPKTTNDITSGSGCGFCFGRITNNINCIATTHSHLIEYFKNKDDAYNLTSGSHKSIELICKYCKTPKKLKAYNFCKNGIMCNFCSDNISVPEKMMANVLRFLKVEYEPQMNRRWSNRKCYDFYLPNENIIIETNGEFHYSEINIKGMKRNLKQEQENDKLKYNLAIENGIKPDDYIVIDCRKSEFEWLKENIIKELSGHFNLSDVNWESCFEKSSHSSKVKCWELFNNGMQNLSYLAMELNICIATVDRWLKDGDSIKITNYKL